MCSRSNEMPWVASANLVHGSVRSLSLYRKLRPTKSSRRSSSLPVRTRRRNSYRCRPAINLKSELFFHDRSARSWTMVSSDTTATMSSCIVSALDTILAFYSASFPVIELLSLVMRNEVDVLNRTYIQACKSAFPPVEQWHF